MFNVTPQSLCVSVTQSFGMSTFVYVCACVRGDALTLNQPWRKLKKHIVEACSFYKTFNYAFFFFFLFGKMHWDYDW